MSLALANGFLLLLVLVELAVISLHRKEAIPWREVVFNLNSGHVLMWVLRGMEVGAFQLVLQYGSWHLLKGWNYTAVWLFAFVAWDFCFYWLHRLHHKYKFLWAIHVIHHEGEHFNLSLGIRNSWYSSITSFPFFVILALIGVPLEVFIATSSIHYFIQFYNHNSIVKKSGWLEHVLITPAHHRVHHGLNPEYLDHNFGGTFVFWDKLFGTFQPEIASVPIVFGVKDHDRTYNVAWANNLPFFKLFGIKVKPSPVSRAGYRVSDPLVAAGGVLLFGLLLYYIFKENTWAGSLKFQFFSIIFLGTLGNGGISEEKYWGLFAWCLNTLLLTPLFLLIHQITDPLLLVLAGLLALHGGWAWAGVLHQRYARDRS